MSRAYRLGYVGEPLPHVAARCDNNPIHLRGLSRRLRQVLPGTASSKASTRREDSTDATVTT